MNLIVRFHTFSNANTLRNRGCIFKAWPDKKILKGAKDSEESFLIKWHPMGSYGIAGDKVFNIEPGA